MDALFREIKIYAAARPEVRAGRRTTCCCRYTEAERRPDPRGGHHRGRRDGQLHRRRHRVRHRGVPMVPFFIFYSMFGFQRVGDLIWQAADARARGLPARRHRRPHDAARRGPAAPGRPQPRAGLDGADRARPTTRRSPTRWRRSSRHGIAAHVRRPTRDRDVFYYLTLYNENYLMPAMPGRRRRRAASSRASTGGADAPDGPCQAGHDPVLRLGASGAPGRGDRAGRALRRRRRAVVGDVVQGAARGGAGDRALEPPAPRRRQPRTPHVAPAARRRRRARSSPSPTS